VGYGSGRVPKFVKQYGQVSQDITGMIENYISDVKNSLFPEKSHTFTMKEEELQALYGVKE